VIAFVFYNQQDLKCITSKTDAVQTTRCIILEAKQIGGMWDANYRDGKIDQIFGR
jgi:hypothetical protein